MNDFRYRDPMDLLQVVGLVAFALVLVSSVIAWRRAHATTLAEGGGYMLLLFVLATILLIGGIYLLIAAP
jgi:hypothetical protein